MPDTETLGTVASIVTGAGVAMLVFRAQRETVMEEKRELTWMAFCDWLLIGATLVAIVRSSPADSPVRFRVVRQACPHRGVHRRSRRARRVRARVAGALSAGLRLWSHRRSHESRALRARDRPRYDGDRTGAGLRIARHDRLTRRAAGAESPRGARGHGPVEDGVAVDPTRCFSRKAARR